MIHQTRLRRGSNVYMRDPQRIIPDCVSITGDVIRVIKRGERRYCTVDAYVAKMGGGYPIQITLPYEDLGVRIGTPISQLSGRLGHPGFERFCEIGRSWRYE